MKALSLFVLFLTATSLAAQEPLSIGNRRQLLIDDRFVQQSTGITFVVHAPCKTGDVIVRSEPGLALGGYHTVLWDAGTYHLWYMAGGFVCYARSAAGVHWEKPSLGLASASSETNIILPPNLVMGGGVGGVKSRMHGLMVFLDPNAAQAERFQLVANPDEFNSMLQIFSSPDGVHWKHSATNVITFRSTKPHHLDSQNVIFWDDRIHNYVAYVRKNLRDAGSQGRTVARAQSPDFAHFSPVEDMPVVMHANPGTRDSSERARKTRLSFLDTYTNGTFKYPWADDVYFMFPTEYYHYGGYLAEFSKESPINAGAIDTRFAASRDGINWLRYDHRPWVGLGLKGEFDSRRIYMAYGIVPATNHRELYMYYLGTSETHGWNRDDRNNRLLTAAGLAPTGPSALSRVVLRRDGFVSARAAYSGGEFTTPLLRFSGDQLHLNVDTSASGELRVELVDAQAKPIPQFTLGDCEIIHTANDINRVVRWNSNTSLKELAGQPVRLHFVMRDVDFYAFQFADRGGI